MGRAPFVSSSVDNGRGSTGSSCAAVCSHRLRLALSSPFHHLPCFPTFFFLFSLRLVGVVVAVVLPPSGVVGVKSAEDDDDGGGGRNTDGRGWEKEKAEGRPWMLRRPLPVTERREEETKEIVDADDPDDERDADNDNEEKEEEEEEEGGLSFQEGTPSEGRYRGVHDAARLAFRLACGVRSGRGRLEWHDPHEEDGGRGGVAFLPWASSDCRTAADDRRRRPSSPLPADPAVG